MTTTGPNSTATGGGIYAWMWALENDPPAPSPNDRRSVPYVRPDETPKEDA